MTQPCHQEAPIAEITTAVKYLADMAKQNNEVQSETLKTLKDLLAQGEQIRGLAHRADRKDSETDELFRIVRASELEVKAHGEFIKNHEKEEDRNASLSIYIKGGLAVSAILAITAFMLFLYAHSGYSTRTDEVRIERTEKRK